MATEKRKKKKKAKDKKSKGSVARREREEEADDDEEEEDAPPNLPAVAVDLDNLPAHIAQDTGADEMAGLENMEGRDLIIPRLVIMQSGSPAVKDREAAEGEVYDSVSKDRILGVDEETIFVPCFMYKEFIAWNDRGSNELWAGRSLDPRSDLALAAQRGDKRQDDKGKDVFVVTEHINFIVLIPELGLDKPWTISCAKSNWKHGKQLMNLARYRRKQLFAGTYTVGIQEETNPGGDRYSAYEFANAGWATEDEYAAAKACYEVMRTSFDAGLLKADQDGMQADTVVTAAADAETEM